MHTRKCVLSNSNNIMYIKINDYVAKNFVALVILLK